MTLDSGSWSASAVVEARVETLLRQMTLEQKIALVSGQNDVAGQPDLVAAARAQWPAFALADGPAGVRLPSPLTDTRQVTAWPAPIALAAAWDPDLARQYGDLIGAEMAATGHTVMLGPAIDIARAPLAGRTFESFGEDPLLQARLVVPEVQAIQAHGVQTCLKHYIVNNQEHRRNSLDVRVDERTLQELYLPPFAAAVQAGQAASVMGSYNKINGTFACENPHTLTEILRGQLGFRGWVMSDYLANHSTAASALAGLEWELGPSGWGPQLLTAVQSGALSAEGLDEMVRRILRPTIGLGQLEQPLEIRPLPTEAHRTAARAIAEQGIVLLKNEGAVLPLANTVRSIAVIGADADNLSAAGGGSSYVLPADGLSVLAGVQRRAGPAARVEFARGVDPVQPGALLPGLSAIPSAVLTPPEAGVCEHGLRAEFWANPNFEGEPRLVRIDPQLELARGFFDLFGSTARPLPADLGFQVSARWTGWLTAPASGEYSLSFTSLGTARVFLDDQSLIEAPWPGSNGLTTEQLWTGGLAPVYTARMSFEGGRPYALRVEYGGAHPDFEFLYGFQVRLGWQMPAGVLTPDMAAAAELAGRSEVAIMVARTCESEGMDRPSLDLPNDQARLIQAVAAANPRTIVVLMSGASVEIASWEERVPAILEAWYAGQEQGEAVARVLFGDVNPAGRLPLTFPRSLAQTPLQTPEQYPGAAGTVHYTEGLAVGYRGYDQLGLEPQFAFGHGLSYTQFEYSELEITPQTSAGRQPITVSFTLRNVGARAGVEVAQLYLRPPVAAEPPRRLAGWARVTLAVGEARRVSVTLDPASTERPCSVWGPAGWQLAWGDYGLEIGASARDLRLAGRFSLMQP